MPEKHTITKQQAADAAAKIHMRNDQDRVADSSTWDATVTVKVGVWAQEIGDGHASITATVSRLDVKPLHARADAGVFLLLGDEALIDVARRHAPALIAQALEIAKAIGIEVEA